jgi:hypothetical protein
VALVGIWVMQVEGRGDLWLRLRDPGLVYAYPTLLSTVVYSLIDKEGMATFDATGWSSPLPRAVVYYYLMTALHLPFSGFSDGDDCLFRPSDSSCVVRGDPSRSW